MLSMTTLPLGCPESSASDKTGSEGSPETFGVEYSSGVGVTPPARD